jgi:hypothetical protein
MYTDEPELIEFSTEPWMVDQIIDWFGKDIAVRKTDDKNRVIECGLAALSGQEVL